MPVVRMPDGQLVRFPDGTPREEIRAKIAGKFPAFAEAQKPELGDVFSGAYRRGAENIKATLADDLPAYLASMLGEDEYAKAQLAEGEQRRSDAAMRDPAQYGSYTDVDGFGEGVGFAAERFAEYAPQLIGTGATALAGAAARVNPLVSIALGSYALMAPESFAGIYRETGELAPGAATIAGAVNSALESVTPVGVLRSFTPNMRRSVVQALLKKSGMPPSIAASAATGVVKGAATEGVTEGTQEAVNIAAEQYVADNPILFSGEDWNRVVESAVAGAAVGSPLGGVGGVGRGLTNRGQFRREQDAQAAEAQVQPQDLQEPEAEAQNPLLIPSDTTGLAAWGKKYLGAGPSATILAPDGPLAGKDLSDPAQAAQAQTALKKYLASLKPESKLRPKVDALIKVLEPQGLFGVKTPVTGVDEVQKVQSAAAPVGQGKGKPDNTIEVTYAGPEFDIPVYVYNEPADVGEDGISYSRVRALDSSADSYLPTLDLTGFTPPKKAAATVVQGKGKGKAPVDDIPEAAPSIWSKELLGFMQDTHGLSLKQAAALTQKDVDGLLALAKQKGKVFDGPLTGAAVAATPTPTPTPTPAPTEQTQTDAQILAAAGVSPSEAARLAPNLVATLLANAKRANAQRAQDAIDAEAAGAEELSGRIKRRRAPQTAPVDTGETALKDPAMAKLVYRELGVTEAESAAMPDEEFDAAVGRAVQQAAKRNQRTEESEAPVNEVPVEASVAEVPVDKTAAGETSSQAIAPKADAGSAVEAPEAQTDAAFRSEFSGLWGTYTAKLNYRIADAKRELAQGEEVPQGIRASLGVEIEPLQAEVDRLEALRPVAQRLDDSEAYANINKAMLSEARQELDVSNLSPAEKRAAVEAASNAASAGEASQVILDAVDAKEGKPKTLKASAKKPAAPTKEVSVETSSKVAAPDVQKEAAKQPAEGKAKQETPAFSSPPAKGKAKLEIPAKGKPTALVQNEVDRLGGILLSDAVKKRIQDFKRGNPSVPVVEGKTLTNKDLAANYLNRYESPDLAIDVMVAESIPDYSSKRTVLSEVVEDAGKIKEATGEAQRALAWVNTSMGAELRGVIAKKVVAAQQEADTANKIVQKKDDDELVREVSDYNQTQNQTAYALKDVPGGEKARRIANKRKTEETGVGTRDRTSLKATRIEQEFELKKAEAFEGTELGEADLTEGVKTSYAWNMAADAQTKMAKSKTQTERDKIAKEALAGLALIKKFRELELINEGKTPEEAKALAEAYQLKTPKYRGADFDQNIKDAVAAGDLQGAIKLIIAARDKRGESKDITKLIQRINSRVGNTKLAESDLPEASSGAYSPTLDTIFLSTETGLNEHTLLHESGHAALAQALDKPDLPITKKFNKFFEQVKGLLGDTYGGTDLQEFAAEFVGNGEFQALLKQIKAPKSENLFVRIVQAIAEFFGLRKSDTAYDSTLKFLNEVLDVSQGIEPSLAETLYLGSGNVDQVLSSVSDTFMSRTNEAALNKLSNVTNSSARVFVLGSTALNNFETLFGEGSARYGKNHPLPIGKLTRALEKRRGEENAGIDRTSINIQTMSAAERKATAKQREAFNDFAIDARLQRIDIFKEPPKTPAARAQFDALTNRYNNLTPGLRTAYKVLRKELDGFLKEYVALISELLPTASATKLMKEFMSLEGTAAYVPFERRGKFLARYDDPANLDAKGNPKDTPRSFDSWRERDMFIKALLAKNPSMTLADITQSTKVEDVNVPSGLPEGQFVTKLIGEMRKNNVEEGTIRQIYQQYVSMFPEKSIMQQLKKSKNLPGMDRDIISAYSNVSIKWISKIANTRWNPQIESALDEVESTANTFHGTDKNMQAAKEALMKQKEFFLNPSVAPLSSALTFASYVEYILGSVSSAVVNTTGLLFSVLPMLGARTSFPSALGAMHDAGKVAMRDWSKGKYAALHQELDSRGLLSHTVAREALERGKTKGSDFDGVLFKATKFLSIPFAESEKYIRATTAIAAYELAMKQGVPSEGVPANNPMAAVEFAAKIVRDAHTGGMAETMPRWAQGNFGRVIWTFKNIVLQQTFVLALAMKRAFYDSDLPPGVKRAAIRQVIGTYGLSFAFLGAKGIPLLGATTVLMRAVELVIPDDDDEPYDPRMQLKDIFGDYAYKGLISSVLDVDVSSRAALANDILWRDDPKSIEDYGYTRTILTSLAGPMGSYALGAERAITEDIPNGQWGLAFEGLAPTSLRNGVKSIRFMNEGARNRDGDPIYTDFDAWNILTQSIGFTPAALSDTYEQRSAAKNYENNVLARKQRILDRYKMAMKTGDRELQAEAVEEAANFRRQFPTLMDDKTLERSYKASVVTDSEDTMAGITFTKGLRYITDDFFE